MKALVEHLIVGVVASVMAFIGYWLMGRYGSSGQHFIELHDVGWTIWTSVVPVITWLYLYRMCRTLHWMVLPVMGIFSPLIGALLFVIPYLWAPFLVIYDYAAIVFPVGVATGLLVSFCTLPFRPMRVLRFNA